MSLFAPTPMPADGANRLTAVAPNRQKARSVAASKRWFLALLMTGTVALGVALTAKSVLADENTIADPKTKSLPIGWDKAYFKIIASPDSKALESGDILYDVKQLTSSSAMAQTMGLINASPDACYKAAKDYNNYTKTMPFTAESRVIRKYPLEGQNSPGAEAVDFWTRVSVVGFETRYLIRIAHLEDVAASRYRTFWTLVDNPSQVPCTDNEKRPCENDLAANLGSHLFEPYKGNPKKTLHTYTVKLVGKTWAQRTALSVGGGTSMKEVTASVRKSAEKK